MNFNIQPYKKNDTIFQFNQTFTNNISFIRKQVFLTLHWFYDTAIQKLDIVGIYNAKNSD